MIYRDFLRNHLALRGSIARGEAIVMPDEKVYLGQAIIDAHKLEKSLDMTGIVLSDGLECKGSVAVEVTFTKDQTKKIMRVPTHRDSMARGSTSGRDFQMLRIAAGADYTQRYRNSEAAVATMMKIDQNDLKLTTDPDYQTKEVRK